MSWMIQIFKANDLQRCWIAHGRTAKKAVTMAAKYKPVLLPFLGQEFRKHREIGGSRRYSYRVDFNEWRIYVF